MYRLEVHHPGKLEPTASGRVFRAEAVLETIPTLLSAHPDCERIVVWSDHVRLFAVDCQGNSISG